MPRVYLADLRIRSTGIGQHRIHHDRDQPPDGNGNPRYVGTDSTWNVYGSYKPIRPLTVLVGIRNVLNHNPPFSNQLGNWPSGYNPVYSDPTLRTFYVNLRYNFL